MGITSDMFPKPDKPFMIDIEYKNTPIVVKLSNKLCLAIVSKKNN